MDTQVELMVKSIIRDEFIRLRKELGVSVGGVGGVGGPGGVAEGCSYNEGCCYQKGCCMDNGCCSKTGDDWLEVSKIFESRADVLKEYVQSNKDAVRDFFKKHGVEVHF
ncbi:MAG: hypothetical protein ACLGSA_04820 [Acidobacteriota bacterium]